jgi:hypothetical protein
MAPFADLLRKALFLDIDLIVPPGRDNRQQWPLSSATVLHAAPVPEFFAVTAAATILAPGASITVFDTAA